MPLKSKKKRIFDLNSFRYIISIFTLFALLFPFVMQQTFFPFYRFGMFAEPVTRTIQSEIFMLIGIDDSGFVEKKIGDKVGIDQSKLDYLLRNYYYRQEADKFVTEFYKILPDTNHIDTVLIVRKLQNDSSIVARFPTW